MSEGIQKYWGFISYSHRDRQWGEWLHKAIESYRVPTRLAGTTGRLGVVPKRLFPIFRDRTELSAGGGLDAALQQALASARCFILICSPAAAASRWVNEEILHFKRLGGEARILCLIVDGEPNASANGHPERECFPPALRYKLGADGELSDIPAEPLAADLREQADGREHAKLKIIAGLLGVGFDDLKRRDLQTRNRRLVILASISSAVAAVTLALAVKAVVAQRAAERSRQQGEDLIGFMLGDLRDKLEPLGKLDILDAVGDKAMAYFSALADRNLTDVALVARAKALRQIGDIRIQQGRAAEARTPLASALALNQQLSNRYPNDPELIFETGQSEFSAGYAAWRTSEFDLALTHFQGYLEASQRLVAIDSSNPKWQLEVVYSLNNLGALASAQNQDNAALGYFQQSAQLLRAITPQTDETRASLISNLAWQGITLLYLDQVAESLSVLREQAEISRKAAAERPDDAGEKLKLAYALSALASTEIEAGDPIPMLAVASEGLRVLDPLIANDKTNVEYPLLATRFEYVRALALAAQQHWDEARKTNSGNESALVALHQRNPLDTDSSKTLLRSQLLAFDIAMAQNQPDAAARAVQLGLEAGGCIGDSVPLADAVVLCAYGQLKRLELAVNAGASSDADNARNAIATLLEKLGADNPQIRLRDIRARVQFLNGETDAGLATLSDILLSGYRPLSLTQLLRRHCSGDIEPPNPEHCSAAILDR